VLMITKINPPTVKVKSPSIETEYYLLNEYEFLHLRVQIKKGKRTGWKWVHDQGIEIEIRPDGGMEIYPNEFSILENYYVELLWGE